ncbi:hypothetical protein [Pseudobacteriovorax antillogorgiicola]|uniref:Uncharacterized protein n=1 Tax=Pseudobacteriovorax antillogorgiicola TaxID=1513793 RepID=A0A1Y6BR04_9BACT|nr:hypothetical protein [Pseudobacteriovorax antillogorgiicola]TCS53754.1 hypothetical protein EDD56_10763 [Pseudobacteriovorax antillogorgiicola]SMF22567.1 hypothetical protein SAMN06296036_107209 [Pseudobacteriovorax antillogorgiicola]
MVHPIYIRLAEMIRQVDRLILLQTNIHEAEDLRRHRLYLEEKASAYLADDKGENPPQVHF